MNTELETYRKKPIRVKDVITGFEGIITGHADYITGCDQFLVQPSAKDGEWKEARWFDEKRLEVVDFDISSIKLKESKENGADISAPIK